MPLLLAPVLAQLITLGLQDRTEARDVVRNTQRYEAQTTPSLSLTLKWPRSMLLGSYGASLIVAPLESPARKYLVFHTVGLSTSYQLRQTTFSLGNTTSFGKVNFQTAALGIPLNGMTTPTPLDGAAEGTANPPADGTANPPVDPNQPGTMTPGQTPTTARQLNLADRNVRYFSNTTTLNVGHTVSRSVTINAGAVYSYASGLGDESKRYYPAARTITLNASTAHTTKLSRNDSLGLTVAALDTRSGNGNHSSSLLGTDTWSHGFNRNISSSLGGGLSIVRVAQDNGLIAYTILPTFIGGIGLNVRAGGGNLILTLGSSLAPVPDALRGTIDPRLGSTANVGWGRGRFAAIAAGNTTRSLAPRGNDAGALDSYTATSTISYKIAGPLSADMGARLAKQQFQRQTTLPLSYTLFVGLNMGYSLNLTGGRR